MRKARQHTLYCTPVEKATIQAAAAEAELSVSRFTVMHGLRNAAARGDMPAGEALALSGEEQLALVAGMERLTSLAATLREPLPGIGVTALEALAFVHRLLTAEAGRSPPSGPGASVPPGDLFGGPGGKR